MRITNNVVTVGCPLFNLFALIEVSALEGMALLQ